jgi:uncharacterized phage infection (PIP) family protein YhgE
LEKPVAEIRKQQAAFVQASKLYLEPNQKLENGVVGMALHFASSVETAEALGFKEADKAPFFELTVPKGAKDGAKLWSAYQAYAKGLQELVEDKLNKIIEDMQEVAARVSQVETEANADIEKLAGMQKVKAQAALPKNVSLLKERADSVNKHAQELRDENQSLRANAQRLKDILHAEEFKDALAKLKAKPSTDARAAYREVYG